MAGCRDATSNWFLLVDGSESLGVYDQICDPNPDNPGTENPESGSENAPPSDPCPAGLGGLDFSLNLLALSLSVTCEEVTLEAEVGEGWLNGFVSGSHNFKKGSNTIYAGAQVGVKVSIGPLSGGPSARGGLYATFGADGSVQDVGVRGGTFTSVSVTPVTASVSGPETSIRFVGLCSAPSA